MRAWLYAAMRNMGDSSYWLVSPSSSSFSPS
nr:MAG TPA: Orf1a polyprotein-like protein [Caudoviricetes sp.]